jgi:hypothetical protein
MRKVIVSAVFLGSIVAVWACSSSSSPPSNFTSNNDSGTGSTTDDSSTTTTNTADGSPSCSQADIDALIKAYAPDASVGDGGIPPCVQSGCSSEISACSTESCTDCQQAIIGCAITACISLDASFTIDAALDGSTCDAPGPECTALSKCCTGVSEIATLSGNATLMSYSTMCTTNASSCNESACMQTISAVNTIGAGFGNSMACAGP